MAGVMRRRSAFIRIFKASKHTHAFLTLTGMDMELQGRMLHRRVSLIILHWALSFVTREETPIPQLREHSDQEVVWTTHSSLVCFQATRDERKDTWGRAMMGNIEREKPGQQELSRGSEVATGKFEGKAEVHRCTAHWPYSLNRQHWRTERMITEQGKLGDGGMCCERAVCVSATKSTSGVQGASGKQASHKCQNTCMDAGVAAHSEAVCASEGWSE